MIIPAVYSTKSIACQELAEGIWGIILPEAECQGRFVCLLKDFPSCAATGNSPEEAKFNALFQKKKMTPSKDKKPRFDLLEYLYGDHVLEIDPGNPDALGCPNCGIYVCLPWPIPVPNRQWKEVSKEEQDRAFLAVELFRKTVWGENCHHSKVMKDAFIKLTKLIEQMLLLERVQFKCFALTVLENLQNQQRDFSFEGGLYGIDLCDKLIKFLEGA